MPRENNQGCIHESPSEGSPTLQAVTNIQFCQNFQKPLEIEKILHRIGVRTGGIPSDPPLAMWTLSMTSYFHILLSLSKALHDCTACPPGTYHDGSVIEEPQYCMNCSINTFSPYTGAKVCQPCSSGFVTESTGAENCGKSFIHRTYVESQKISIFLGIFSFFGQKRVGVNLVLVLFCWLFLLYLNSLLQ